MFKLKSLSAKATLLVVALCLVSSASLMVLAYVALRSEALDEMAQEARSARSRAQDVLTKIGQRVDAYATIYAVHPEVVSAVMSGDRPRMAEVFARLYKMTNALDPVVSTMEVTNAAGVVIMRGHNPDRAGDDKSKEPMVRGALDRSPSSGLTASPTTGEVATDAVRPIMADGKVIGTLKIGSYFRGGTASELKRLSGAETVMLYKGKVNASTIEGVKTLELPAGTLNAAEDAVAIDIQSRTYETAALTLPIQGGDPLVVLSLRDRQPELDKLFRFETSLILKSLAVLALIVPLVIVAVRRSVRTIQDLTQSMQRLANGELDTAIPHAARTDEIGDMARAVGVFKENALQVNAFEAQERVSGADRLARAEAMAAIVTEVGLVVERAAQGDFSARVASDNASDDIRRLADGVNEINRVVDVATRDFVAVLSAVSHGDLTQTVSADYRGRFGELKSAVNETISQLSETVSTIQMTASQVGASAKEITTGANDLSQRTEQQASSLEETAATTEQLAASVKASAQASRQASDLSSQAMGVAEQGGAIAGDAIQAMSRIESASQKISDIIRVIDDIAFQTNLLALNAAVEAARAGDAGKGFAVVASEVRTLAQRSGEAAKDISILISSSNSEVENGVALVRKAGDALGEILAASRKVAATIADISAAAAEQANGIDEMSQAVAHMDEMTQQNAALSEQSAASATSLVGQIESLNGLVATFKTRGPSEAAYDRNPPSKIVELQRLRSGLRR